MPVRRRVNRGRNTMLAGASGYSRMINALLPNAVREVKKEEREIRCKSCLKPMNPADAIVSSYCLSCAKRKHREATE